MSKYYIVNEAVIQMSLFCLFFFYSNEHSLLLLFKNNFLYTWKEYSSQLKFDGDLRLFQTLYNYFFSIEILEQILTQSVYKL